MHDLTSKRAFLEREQVSGTRFGANPKTRLGACSRAEETILPDWSPNAFCRSTIGPLEPCKVLESFNFTGRPAIPLGGSCS